MLKLIGVLLALVVVAVAVAEETQAGKMPRIGGLVTSTDVGPFSQERLG